jgi:hypothetical protein
MAHQLPIVHCILVVAITPLLAITTIGCSFSSSSNIETKTNVKEVENAITSEQLDVAKKLSEDEVLEIAKRELANCDTWSDRAEFKVSRDGDGWSVYIERLPRTPGGHRVVSIDAAGNVTEYFRGL